MGLEQRAGQIAPQEFNFSQKKFEGKQPIKDLRNTAEETLNKERNTMSPDGFEPFGPSDYPNANFVNGYRGNFSYIMQINRKAVEKVLKIAHLDGKVYLSSFDASSKRSIEANSDGSITAKRGLFMGQKIEDENREPLYKVKAVPQGWRIEINDKRMVDTLSEKGLSGEKLKKEFISNFNGFVNAGLLQAVMREKLSEEKDTNFKGKVLLFVLQPVLAFGFQFSASGINPGSIRFGAIFSLFYIGLGNLFTYNRLRKTDNPLEIFMPFVEVDKVARTYSFLQGKGRALVK